MEESTPPPITTKEDLVRIVEAILFVSGDTLSKRDLMRGTGVSPEALEEALTILSQELEDRGLRLLQKDGMVSLVTAPFAAPYIEHIIKEHVLGELSKAALETLTIVAYKHPVSRAEIDYIRGVNSTFTLRNLAMRGLIERLPDPHNARSYVYNPTLAFMKFLGIASFEELPEYNTFRNELEKGITEQHEQSES